MGDIRSGRPIQDDRKWFSVSVRESMQFARQYFIASLLDRRRVRFNGYERLTLDAPMRDGALSLTPYSLKLKAQLTPSNLQYA